MGQGVRIVRRLEVPDPVRVARAQRLPELGPRVLFFSGGSALRRLSRRLKHYTHNSVHLITPFDSGGSSARLRDAFAMLSVGDVRNRLIALADESVLGNPEIARLFSHRLDHAADSHALAAQLAAMIRGEHPLVASVPPPLQQIVRTHLQLFATEMPPDFDLRGASIGNLMLAGGYLANNRDIDSVAFLFSQLLEVRGLVRTIVDADLHLAARLEDGSHVIGQMMLTGKEVAPIASPVERVFLVEAAADHTGRVPQRLLAGDERPPDEVEVHIAPGIGRLIRSADVICYPMGSVYSSVMANLLPRGVGRAIAAADCPRVWVCNTAADPESLGRSHAELVERLIALVRQDAGPDTPVERIVDTVLVDTRSGHYSAPLELERLAALGVQVADVDLVSRESAPLIDADCLARVLVSLG